MKLRFLLAAAVFVVTGCAAQAQVGIYLNPIATRVSNSTLDTSTYSFLGPTSTARTFWGIDYGIYYDFAHSNSIRLGVDLRGSDLHANNGALKDLLVGLRVSGQPFASKVRPYAQLSIGAGYTKAPASAISIGKVQFRAFGGLDYPIGKHVDFRAVEVGYGTLQTISSSTVGNGGNIAIPASTMLSVSSGLVFRF